MRPTGRSAYHQNTHAAGKTIATNVVDSFASCPIPEVARLGKTLKTWRTEFLSYLDTAGASNGGTEAICESGAGWSGIGWQGWFRSC